MSWPKANRVSSWLAVLAAAAASIGAASAKNTNTGCDCFLANGTNAAYYARHRFLDYRSLGDYAKVPDLIKDPLRKANVTSDYFSSSDWTDHWDIQDWDNRKGTSTKDLDVGASVFMVNSPNNIYIQPNDDKDAASDTFLTFRTARLDSFQTASEVESRDKFHHLSIRMLARATGSPGAVLALFTYLTDEDLQEADIEILTSGPRDRIQYTNQPSYNDDDGNIAAATRNASLPRGDSFGDWAVHRLDWTAERCVWSFAGHEVARIAFQTPRDPSLVMLNAWGDGGSWSGNMTKGGAAYLQIQWMEMLYNTTADTAAVKHKAAATCGTVCSIDEADKAGAVKQLWKPGSGAPGGLVPGLTGSLACWGLGILGWMVYLLAL